MWPYKIIRQFNTVPRNPSESDYDGPYNKLLYTLFPPDSDFVVAPQFLPDSRNSADFFVMFEILLVNRPVLILEFRPPSHRNFLSKRRAADEQIRSRMTDLVGKNLPLETLYAVSALGTKLCFYSLDTTDNNAEIVPAAIPRRPTRMNDTATEDRWDYDILEPVGGAIA
ncbi:hypothetical protein M422DRAFT_163242 [Sphaerobolus stellatus SS14]|uniref:Uncharacterized protein n=1 Tax=Sphaerobolus stellatus (strain SS14) TaxID=990650 RepID=A0A0C9VJ46_SPHS4|nr:hypothetical protein M422DRAFT_163242 [Sphaerobolus stellatus SS14]